MGGMGAKSVRGIARADCGCDPPASVAFAPRRRAVPGFTLLEVLLVIIIVSVLTAMLVPSFGDATRAEQLPESAYRLKALIAMCRAEAMNQSKRFRIAFRQDGGVRVYAQEDALLAPQSFLPVRPDWGRGPFLLEDAWIEAVQPLPNGPAPVLVEDDVIEFTTLEETPVSVTELAEPHYLYFEPDGSSESVRWVLRDAQGRAMLITLDGRLGRVQVEHHESVEAKSLQRPPPLADEEQPVPLLETTNSATSGAGGRIK